MTQRKQPAAPCVPREGANYCDQPAFEFECFALLGREVGEADARHRLGQFFGDARLWLDEMRAGSARGDMAALKAGADRLKDASALLGLARLAAISRELEQVAASADISRVETLRHGASAALHDAQPFIDEVLAAAL